MYVLVTYNILESGHRADIRFISLSFFFFFKDYFNFKIQKTETHSS